MKAVALAGSMRPRAVDRRVRRLNSSDRLVLAYLVAVFIAAAAAALALAAYMNRAPDAPPAAVGFVVGAAALHVPLAWLRPGAPRTGGPTERLDLVIPWPEEPRAAAPGEMAKPTQAIDRVVLLSITPADEALAPADRPVKLYARFLNGEVWPNPGGLILRRFRNGTPYEEEDLYVSPPDGRAFAARCPRANPAGALTEGCVAEIRVGGLDAQLRFAPTRLVAWERLSEGVRRAVAGMLRAAD